MQDHYIEQAFAELKSSKFDEQTWLRCLKESHNDYIAAVAHYVSERSTTLREVDINLLKDSQ